MSLPVESLRIPRVAPMAIVALVVALFPLCPPLNLIGVLLGCIALRRVARSGGALRGRGAAVAAIVLGLGMGGGAWWAWADTSAWLERSIRREAASTTDAFFQRMVQDPVPSPEEIAGLWRDARPPAEADLRAFASALKAAGPVTGVQVGPPQPAGGLSGDMDASVLLTTDQGRLNGGVVLVVEFTGAGMPQLHAGLKSVSVHLPAGDIELSTGGAAP